MTFEERMRGLCATKPCVTDEDLEHATDASVQHAQAGTSSHAHDWPPQRVNRPTLAVNMFQPEEPEVSPGWHAPIIQAWALVHATSGTRWGPQC